MIRTYLTDAIRDSVRRARRVVLWVSVMSLASLAPCALAPLAPCALTPGLAAQGDAQEARSADLLPPGIRQDTLTRGRAAPFAEPRDLDNDGVFDDYDSCPDSAPDAVVDEFGCAQQSGMGWVGLATGAAVVFVLVIVAVQWFSRREPSLQPLTEGEDDWVVLPVSAEAKDAGIKPAAKPAPPPGPRPGYTGQPPGYPPQSYAPPVYPQGQPGYPPQQPYPQGQQPYPPGQPGYPPQPWPTQPGYYQQQPYPPQQPYGQPPPAPPQTPPLFAPQARPAEPATSGGAPTPPSGVPTRSATDNAPVIGPGDPIPEGETIDEGQVRFHRPPEGTLQLLPGRLDVEGGDEGRGGIRFVKIPAEEPEVTFGRSPGDQYRHIQLKIPTVSRMHARMRYKDGDWWIENLSSTNPVVLNGHPMGADTRKSLDDGDRIEMGEVVFRYWV